MQRYIIRRILQGILILFLVSIIVFILGRQIGDPVALLLPEYSTEADKIRLTEQLGLDKSLPEQYAIFMGNALQGDLGNSIRGARAPALDLVLERVPASLMLASIAVLISALIGLPLGVMAAVKEGRYWIPRPGYWRYLGKQLLSSGWLSWPCIFSVFNLAGCPPQDMEDQSSSSCPSLL